MQTVKWCAERKEAGLPFVAEAAMAKLKAPKDMDKKAEGNRRVASMRSKMNTYKNANRRYGRAAHVDQAMAEQNDLLEAESGLQADEEKLLMKFQRNTLER